MEHMTASFSHHFELTILQIVSIQVVKTSVHHLGVDVVVVPHLNEVCQQLFSILVLDLWEHLILKILFSKLLEDHIDLLITVI